MVEKQLMDIMTEAGGVTEPKTNWADLLEQFKNDSQPIALERGMQTMQAEPSIGEGTRLEKYRDAQLQKPPSNLTGESRIDKRYYDPMLEHSKYEQKMELEHGKYWRLSPEKRKEMEERDRLMRLEMMGPKNYQRSGIGSFMYNPSIEDVGY